MKKKSFTYSDLSNKQLENLKEFYIQKKVESMSHKELEQYVREIISHQINDTIDKEEEMEAWKEMSDFFGDQFEIVIQEMQAKYMDNKNGLEKEIDDQQQRLELLERNKLDQEKKVEAEDNKSEVSADNLKVLENIEVKLTVEVGSSQLKIRDLLRLNEGSVVELERLAGDPLDILANGVQIAKGEVVMVGERFGVRFTEVSNPQDTVKKL